MSNFAQAGVVMAVLGAVGAAALLGRRNQRLPKSLADSACPECGQTYGEHIFVTVVSVSYRWTVARGHTRASLKLPRTTHLVTCPQCLAEFEFKEDGILFEHPQQGILSCVRSGRSRNFHRPARRLKMNLAV